MLGLVEQYEIFTEVAEDAFDDMLLELQERKWEIINLAEERLGSEEYGDEMWDWDDERRDAEWTDSIADAVNYKVGGRG